ncbi:MAG: hypothetical protein HY909_06240 [Deltaproteobacteria bacterium]|nr:hypothetical protein [Deltaproteobacteria bacterium]
MSAAPPSRMRPWRGALLALLAAVCALAAGASREVRSSAVCVRCHSEPGVHPRGHRAMACSACHAQGPSEGLGLLARAVVGARPTGRHAAVVTGSCVACHAQRVGPWRRLGNTEVHREHPAQIATCVRCHGASLHGRRTPREGCTPCHANTPMRSEPRGDASCTQCHRYSDSPGQPTDLHVVGTSGLTVDAQRLHGAMDCRGCHDPHREQPARTNGDCTGCHRGSMAREVSSGPEGHRTCDGCHAAHAPRAQVGVDCGRCHRAPERGAAGSSARGPDAGRLARWVTFVAGGSRAAPEAQAGTVAPAPATPRGHHQGTCASCHRPHTWVARADDCRTCHDAPSGALPRETPGHGDCVACHDPHGPVPDRDTCGRCHGSTASEARQAGPAPHRDCLSCHAGHGPATSARGACASCHEGPSEALEGAPAAHRDCRACHAPHGDPGTGPARCASCHAREAGSVGHGAHRDCTSCHQPHRAGGPAGDHAGTRTCAGCHAEAAAPGASHRGTCSQCHAPHDGVPSQGTGCATCHAGVHANSAGHARCESCHAPHRPAREALGRCESCHARATASARTWAPETPHGGRCEGCHSAHGPTATATCTACHAAQGAVSHTGRHGACAQCHAPHQDRPRGPAGWWARCGACHVQQAGAAQGAAPAHRDCANCHQRPGLTAPSCASCHASTAGRLLHGHPAHARCSSCHGNHGTEAPTRARCLSCHQDRTTHFPDAPRCQSCHPFAGAPP